MQFSKVVVQETAFFHERDLILQAYLFRVVGIIHWDCNFETFQEVIAFFRKHCWVTLLVLL